MGKPSEQAETRKEQAPRRQVVVIYQQEGGLKNQDTSLSWEETLSCEIQQKVSYFQSSNAPWDLDELLTAAFCRAERILQSQFQERRAPSLPLSTWPKQCLDRFREQQLML